MTIMTTEIINDPLFQLNTVLWLTQPLPEKSLVAPLLHQKGFRVYAIAPALGVPPDIVLRAQSAQLEVQQRARPDVILANKLNKRFVFVECKASSFSITSDQAKQARAFLLMAGERVVEEVLGLPTGQVSSSILEYVLPEDQRISLQTTLNTLSNELRRHSLPVGKSGVMGFEIKSKALCVVFDENGGQFLGITPNDQVVMRVDSDTDPRPLYFIPYDPDVDQSEEERRFCKRVLFERIHSAVLVAIGRAEPLGDLRLEITKLLNDATFGMYNLWENPESAKHMRALCRQLLDALSKAVNKEINNAFAYESSNTWKISLSDAEKKQQVLAAVERFSCETMDLKAPPMPGLFDE